MAERWRIAVFKFTGCAGCQLELLHLEDELLDLAGMVDISYWFMTKRENYGGPYDISFVEGSVSTPREIMEIKKVRANSKTLVAFGDCAISGCIPSIRNWIPQWEAEKLVYEDPSTIYSTKVYGIDEYVPVDAYLRGCPPHRNTFLEFLKATLRGIKPYLPTYPVCVECKLNENICLIVSKREPCMGPVTNAGCGAICPTLSRVCEGCYGPMSNPNTASMAKVLGGLGLSKGDIVRKFRKYAGMSPEFREEAGPYE